jgi:hypothetical protein
MLDIALMAGSLVSELEMISKVWSKAWSKNFVGARDEEAVEESTEKNSKSGGIVAYYHRLRCFFVALS